MTNYFIFYYLYLFIYLFILFLAVLGLSCGMQDLCCGTRDLLLQCAGFSLVVACGFSLSSCGAWAPEHVDSVVVACGRLPALWHVGS